ncbi:MAG: topoisomerase DNA-binding C4 zinc finger domain-containing protein, partial [Syntrophales bacterium]|nr:topoisomerase DNA-binding C4 zinc finger domain-containing protein [Syntrophales bacterium]
LDMIEEGKRERLTTLNDFYQPFEEELKKAKMEMRNVKREGTPTDIVCEKCESPMVIKWGRNGSFMACSNYPACKNTRNVTSNNGEDAGKVEDMTEEIKCEKCGQKMVAKEGRFGKFLACSGYPECKNTMKVNQAGRGGANSAPAVTTDVLCSKCNRNMVIKEGRFGKFLACSGYPDCKNTQPLSMGIKCPTEGCKGEICEKRTKTGRVFYGCSRYPDCKFSTRNKPLKEKGSGVRGKR